MNLILTPSAIHARNNKKKCIYNCPKCDIRLSYRMHRGPIIKTLLPWLPLKKYACLKCLNSYYVYVKTSSKNPVIFKTKYTYDISGPFDLTYNK